MPEDDTILGSVCAPMPSAATSSACTFRSTFAVSARLCLMLVGLVVLLLSAFVMPNATAQSGSPERTSVGKVQPAGSPFSLTTAVDLALRSSPRVLMAQDDVARARALLAETHDVYIPSLAAGAGLGEAYGYSPNPPTLFTFTAGSLVYNASQMFYVRSARAGVRAAQFALQDVRQSVAEDTAIAYLALDHDQQREAVIRQQGDAANTLVKIVQDRVDVGLDRPMDLTQAKLTAAQFRLFLLRVGDDVMSDRGHLARLVGMPGAALTTDNIFPSAPIPLSQGIPVDGSASPAVSSAFANAEAKRQQTIGDDKFRYRPQFNLVAQYNRYATFTDSFSNLQTLYHNEGINLRANEGFFGVQVSLPILDKFRSAKARETAADASRAQHEAENAQFQYLDGQFRLRHSILELRARGEVAALEQQLAQQQLDVLRLQLESGNPGGPPLTPKDEQNSRIGERDKYLGVIDATFQLRQAEIQYLRQSGQLDAWLHAAAAQPAQATP